MQSDGPILPLFHPLVQRWFSRTFSAPTEIQRGAWEAISRGDHALLCAPTGSGKTLAAFLWSIHRYLSGRASGRTLYISPLKALNNDISRNLRTPLEQIRRLATEESPESDPLPEIRIGLRSGDSSSSERARIMRNPPEIFITTPESVNIMLTSEGGRRNLSDIDTVILDEIHVVAGSKRGSLLMANIERLEALCSTSAPDGLQRIGLSATVRPLESVAAFLGGFAGDNSPRPVSIIRDGEKRRYELELKLGERVGEGWWDRQIPLLAEEINSHESTLIFCNSRRAAEKTAYLLNERFGEKVVFAHHGSLSREYRYWVEQQLKDGALKAVVATSSLELGIDVGSIDRVIQLQAPFSVSSAVQRIGRANHQVGGSSSALFAPLHPRDIAKSLAVMGEIFDGDIEPLLIPERPLDVLAQIILSECAGRRIPEAGLSALLRQSYPFRDLGSEEFDSVLEMLAGKYQNTRIAELGQRIIRNRDEGWIEGREGLRQLIYQSGGTIPDRGYFDLRIAGSNEKLGELDEEFVFERSLGDRISIGNRVWQIEDMDNQRVVVHPTSRSAMIAPFWKADNVGSDPWISGALNRLYEDLDQKGSQALDSFPSGSVDPMAAMELESWFSRQKAFTGAPLPGRGHLLIEHLSDPSLTPDMDHFIIHSGWGIPVNAPLMYCIRELFRRREGIELQSFYTDDALVCSLPVELARDADFAGILLTLGPESLGELLAAQLIGTGLFGARFRANAGRSLLVVRRGFDTRTPLWLQRMRSKQLLQKVIDFEDFPIIRETWRELLKDEFALDALAEYLEKISSGEISLSTVETERPSPFASDLMWELNNEYLYADDSLDALSGIRGQDSVVRNLMAGRYDLPEIAEEVCSEYLGKRRRLIEEYRPESDDELAFYFNDRRILTEEEMNEFLDCLPDELEAAGILDGYHRRIQASESGENLWIHRDIAYPPSQVGSQDESPTDLAREWFDWQAFVNEDKARRLWGGDDIDRLLEDDELIRSAQGLIAAPVLERLIRQQRRWKRQRRPVLGAGELQLAAARLSGVLIRSAGNLPPPADDSPDREARIRNLLESLEGHVSRPAVLMDAILATRMRAGELPVLEARFQQDAWCWTGVGSSGIMLCREEDLDLFVPDADAGSGDDIEGGLSADSLRSHLAGGGRYRFEDLIGAVPGRAADLESALVELISSGSAQCDSLMALQRALETKMFNTASAAEKREESQGTIPPPQKPGPQETDLRRGYRRPAGFHELRRSRGHRRDWERRVSIPGRWFSAESEKPEGDPDSLIQDLEYRIAILLRRHPLISREIIRGESPAFSWRELYPVLRNLELAGELVGGKICKELPGLQFAPYRETASAASRGGESGHEASPHWFWLSSYDPALIHPQVSLRKSEGSFVVFLVKDYSVLPIFTVTRWGAEIQLSDDRTGRTPAPEVIGTIISEFYRSVLIAPQRGRNSRRLLLINGAPAGESPLAATLVASGFLAEPGGLSIWKY
jgi:ATP-dependent Lhr-like helicase